MKTKSHPCRHSALDPMIKCVQGRLMKAVSCAEESLPGRLGRGDEGPTFVDPSPSAGAQDDNVAVDFLTLFGNSHPVEIEIGCGKGRFLMASAEQHPEINFIGIDRVGKWMKRRATQTERKNLPNLRYLKADIREWLEAVSDKSVSVFHIYFPDPWPKRKHRKRRLVQAGFLMGLHRKLVAGGRIEMATDDTDYFTHIQKTVAQTAELWCKVTESRGQRICRADMKTNYELKFEAVGKTNYYLELQCQ